MLTYADVCRRHIYFAGVFKRNSNKSFSKIYDLLLFSPPPPLQQCLTPFKHTPKTNNYGASTVQGHSTVGGFTLLFSAVKR